ncbi:MAG: hypothetical protein OSB10_04395 [Planctomycetota bacterium]|nr:hypothetical protein [Planctomycetota bacterium]
MTTTTTKKERQQKRAPNDAKTGWRNMSQQQRLEFLEWLGFRDFHPIDAVSLLRLQSWAHSDKGKS